jgi:eukaryotic-like serine/threonine-protein kinase
MTSIDDHPPEIPGLLWIRSLGGGAAAKVFLARDTEQDSLVAVKVLAPLKPNPTTESKAFKRFEREAEIMSRIQDPHIVAIQRFGTANGHPYLVMEYVAGSDLRAHMVEGSPWPLDRIRELALPLTTALERIHAEGIIHRDLKP